MANLNNKTEEVMTKFSNRVKNTVLGLMALGVTLSGVSGCSRGAAFDPTAGGEVKSMALMVVPNSNRIDVMDLTINRVTTTLQTDDRPSSIAVSPDGRMILVTNENSGTISVYLRRDNETFEQLNSVGSGRRPVGVYFNPVFAEAYVAYSDDSKVLVLDTSSRTASPRVINTITIPDANPKEVVVSRDGTRVFITDNLNDRVVTLVKAGNNFNITSTQPLGQNRASVDFGGMIAVDNYIPGQPVTQPLVTRLFVANSAGSSVFVVDGNSGQLINEIQLKDNQVVGNREVGPKNLAVYRNLAGQQKVYVTGYNASVISVIDAQGFKLLRNIPLGQATGDNRGSFNPVGVSVGNDLTGAQVVYVTNSSGLNISLVDPQTDQLKRNIGTTQSAANQPPLGEIVTVGAVR